MNYTSTLLKHEGDLPLIREALRKAGFRGNPIYFYQPDELEKFNTFCEHHKISEVLIVVSNDHPGNQGTPGSCLFNHSDPQLIFLERWFIHNASKEEIDFVVGHELAHLVLGTLEHWNNPTYSKAALEHDCDALAMQYVGSLEATIEALNRLDETCYRMCVEYLKFRPQTEYSSVYPGCIRLVDWNGFSTDDRIKYLKEVMS